MYNIGICDDVNRVCSYIENIILEYTLKKNRKVNIEVWYTGESLCEYLKTGQEIDILFLDIELFQLNGIQVAEYIRNVLENRRMQIIYISGKDAYAQKLFKTQPMDFLVKPIKKEDVIESVELAFKLLDKENDKFRFQYGKELRLSRLVDTFFSRISLTMQPPPKPHSTACVLPWEEGRHWQSRSSGCSSS